MNSTHTRHSLIGGLIGGTLGFLLCGLTGSPLAQVLGFFVFGYLGYDLRQLVETVRAQAPVVWYQFRRQMGRELDDMWAKDPLYVILSPMIPLVWFVIFAKTMDMDIPNRGLQGGFSLWATPHLFLAKFQWLYTGIGGDGMLTTHNPLIRTFKFAWMFFMSGACSLLAWGGTVIVLRAIYMIYQARAKILWAMKGVPLHFAWLCFWFLPGLIIGLVKLVASVLSLAHSARRMTTGLSTTTAGMLYLHYVPFTIGLPLAATAILCGLCAGAFSAVVSMLLDYTKLDERLSTFLATPISAWSPLPAPMWLQAQRAHEEANKYNPFHNR